MSYHNPQNPNRVRVFFFAMMVGAIAMAFANANAVQAL